MTTENLSAQGTFSELLRRWRRNRGLSQTEFGELLHPKVRHSTVSCWETDVCRPSLRFLGQIVALTGIPSRLALGIDESRQEGRQP
jgi:transcriptional regulator with XRE-family HTH domain